MLLAYPIEVSGGSSVAIPNSIVAPTVTRLAGIEPLYVPDLTPPTVPMSQPEIVPTFPGPDSFGTTGGVGTGVPNLPPVQNTPLTLPPQGCNSCGAPPVVAPASSGAAMPAIAPTAPAAVATAEAMVKSVPWWVWLIVAILALRGLLK